MLFYPKDNLQDASPMGRSLEAPGHWVREIGRIVRRRLPIIAALVAVLMGAAGIYTVFAQRIFTTTTSILVTPNQPAIIGVEAFNPLMGSEALIESQAQILRSEALAKRVVDRLKLGEDDEFNGKRPRLLHRIFEFFLSTTESIIGDSLFPDNVIEWRARLGDVTDEESVRNAASALPKGLTVARVNLTYLINVSYASSSPTKAAQIANAYAEAYLLDQLELRYEQTARASRWLSERLDDLRLAVQKAEHDVEVYRAENNLLLAGGRFLNEQQMSELETQLTLARARVAETRAKLDQAAAVKLSGGDAGAIPEALSSDVITRLKTQYSESSRTFADLTTRFGPKHPAVLNVEAQILDVRRAINEEIQRVIQTFRNEYEVAVAREASLRRSAEEIESRSNEANEAKIRMRELEREATSSRTLYESFLNRYKETSAKETLPSSEARVLSPANVPVAPASPQVFLLIAGAGALGLLAGLAAAFGIEYVDPGVKTRQQVEEGLHLPLLSQIPLVSMAKLKARASYAVEHPLSAYAEAIRTLRMSVSFAAGDKLVIGMASALPAEGKTTTAFNFASYCASAGVKTLLIDADLRRPQLTREYVTRAKVGIVDVLTGQCSLEQAIVTDAKSGLAILPCPATEKITKSAELLFSDAMGHLLENARLSYDLVVIDASPVIPVVDAKALFRHVDRIVLVVHWNVTSRHAVEEALEQLRPWKDRILGIVLNKSHIRRAQQYDHYDSRSYAKRYPHYYGSNQ